MTFPLGSLQDNGADESRGGKAAARKARGRRGGAAPAAAATRPTEGHFPQALRLSHRWVLVATGVFLFLVILAFVTHNPQDAAFSTSGAGRGVANKAGVFGAWLSDFSYFLFGLSAWWFPALGGYFWLRSFAVHSEPVWSWLAGGVRGGRLQAGTSEAGRGASERPHHRLRFMWGLGFLVGASCSLEHTRLYQWELNAPGMLAGGVLGRTLGVSSVELLGFAGSGVVWIACLMLGMSMAFQFSWARVAEAIGAWLESWKAARLSRVAKAEDIQLGSRAVSERDALVAGQRRARENHLPLVIDPPVEVIPKSERVTKEKQKPLFSELSDTKLPQVGLLDEVVGKVETVTPETLEMTSRLIEKKLKDFGVEVQVIAASPGPVITRYEIEPATGVKGSQIVNLAKDLARSLSLVSIRVVETIPGKNLMALELPNAKRQTIRLSEILGSVVYNDAVSQLTIGLGKDIVGASVVADLAKMPHCLVAGTTGSGKSVGINAMILSLLYKAEAKDVRLILIDPKMLEMSVYEGIPHLLCPVVTDMRQAANALNWGVGEMERRYKLMSKLGVRNLVGYNRKIEEATARGETVPNPFSLMPEQPEPLERLPHIVIVIDELADLMMVVGKKIEELIARLAQKARAAGIHLVLATQRPSVDVITGLIKANIPTRIAFQVSSKIDSRTILDQMGAEALLGMGDMLYMASGTGLPIRVHGAFVSDDEVHRVVEYLKSQGEPNYIEGILEGGSVDGDAEAGTGDTGGGESDPMYDQAVSVVLQQRRASISLVQRHLRIGYNRAARLLEQMERSGVVSAMATNGNREILVPAREGE